ncbi:MAG: hypothetical protein ACRDBG_11895, partial [Waterburya sp.]
KIMLEWSLGDFELDWIDKAQNFNVKQWCLANKISYQEVKRIQREKFYKNGLDRLFTPEELVEELEFDRWDNCNEIMDLLKQSNNLNLLSKLWKETIGNFAGIREIHIGKKSYLKIDENLPDIVTPEQKIELLAYADYYEQSDIEFLIESLSSSEIVIRAKAYQLLQNIDPEKLRKARAKGFLLNPGDRVYSVWKSGIGFDDEAYYLNDSCHVNRELIIKENSDFDYNNYYEFYEDYLRQDYIEEEYELSEDDYQDPEIESYESFFAEYIEQDESIKISDRQKRLWDELADLDLEIYSYERGDPLFVSRHICKNQAEKIAESLHQKIMKEHGIGSFIWDKINDLETWCIANNVPYQKDSYRDSIDEKHLMNYLKQPENIHLFSKLWKDAVGSFSFVCEQTVKNKTYLKIDVNCQC